jgi:hypothetical protein
MPKTRKITAEREIGRAMSDVVAEYMRTKTSGKKLFSEPSKFISQDEISALRAAFEFGYLDPAFLGEVAGIQSNKIWQHGAKEAHAMLFKLFMGAESWNRTSTFLAAYRRSQRAGVSNSEAIQKAADIVLDAHFLYGRGNRPLVVRKTGAVGNIAYTFMTYPMNNLVFLKHRAQNILEGVHNGDKKAVRGELKALGSNLAYLFAFGGLIGLPFSWLAQHIIDLFTDDEDDWEILLRKYSRKMGAPDWAGRTLTRGIPASLLGNDMSWRVQGTDALGMPIGFQIAEMFKKRGETAWKLHGQGEDLEALFHLMPDMIRNPYRAVVGFKEGGERKGVPPIKYTATEAVTKALGYTPTREAETFKAGSVARKERLNRLEKLENFAERLNIARKKKDKKAIAEIKKDRQEYNKTQKKRGAPIITALDIFQSAQRRRKARLKGYGEDLPRYMRRYHRETKESLGLRKEVD